MFTRQKSLWPETQESEDKSQEDEGREGGGKKEEEGEQKGQVQAVQEGSCRKMGGTLERSWRNEGRNGEECGEMPK